MRWRSETICRQRAPAKAVSAAAFCLLVFSDGPARAQSRLRGLEPTSPDPQRRVVCMGTRIAALTETSEVSCLGRSERPEIVQ
jgi:hypothetical protein